MAMAMFKRKFARTIPDNLRAPHIKMWGFEAKKGQKVHPNFAPNITIFFHYHAFFFPEGRKVDGGEWGRGGKRDAQKVLCCSHRDPVRVGKVHQCS